MAEAKRTTIHSSKVELNSDAADSRAVDKVWR